jgi:hypothetical protein
MPTIALEGTGARIAFAELYEADLITLTLPERAKNAIGTTHLGSHITTTANDGRLVDPGQVTVEFDHVPGAPVLLKRPPGQVTITYPLRPGLVTPDRLRFNAFATSEGAAEFQVGARLAKKVTLTVTSDFAFLEGDPIIDTAAVSPVLETVTANDDGTWTSLWGYHSRNNVPVTIPISASNRFHPAPMSRGQPTEFLPGRHYGVFEVVITDNLVWSLKGPDGRRRTATAGVPATT